MSFAGESADTEGSQRPTLLFSLAVIAAHAQITQVHDALVFDAWHQCSASVSAATVTSAHSDLQVGLEYSEQKTLILIFLKKIPSGQVVMTWPDVTTWENDPRSTMIEVSIIDLSITCTDAAHN